jgi:chromatin remodeling complex protein RSC6
MAKKRRKKKAARKSAKRKTTRRRRSARRTARRPARRKARRTARKTRKKRRGGKRRPSAAFMKPMTPSATLAAVVGSSAMPRTEVTKKLWAYIKRKGLQDTRNRRMINADAALRAVFGGRSSVNMFEMTRLVNRHLR